MSTNQQDSFKRRSILLVNKKFQIRFSIYVCVFLSVLSLIYPLLIYQIFEYFMNFAKVHGVNSLVLESLKKEIIKNLIFLEAAIICMNFLLSIYLSHRVAGPIYKLSQYFKTFEDGKLRGDIKFRKHDHFKDLADGYNDMVAKLKLRMDENSRKITATVSKLESVASQSDQSSKIEIEKTIKELQEVRENILL